MPRLAAMPGWSRTRGPAVALAIVIAGCSSAATPTPMPSQSVATPGAPSASAPESPAASASGTATACATPTNLPWWSDRVFYEVFVRSFQDSDGDGIGDLQGLISKLDYLNDGDPATSDDLGVTGIWLMPVAQSPSYHGYDVTDYDTVETDYGTNADMRALIDAAHDRGIAVITDLVLNHTSVEHPWFVDSETKGSKHADWYRWSDTDPGITRTDGTQVWHEKNGRWYYGYFWEGMPDLNLENPEVTAELNRVADEWLTDIGVDGFRLDAIRYYVEQDPVLEDVPATKTWLNAFHDHVLATKPDALLVGEAYADAATASSYVPSVDMTFDFDDATALITAAKSYSAGPARTALATSLAAWPPGGRGVFLTNHDQPRVMAELADVARAKLAGELLLTSSGVPFIYYGEEVGLDGTKPDEQIRTPMPWTAKGPGVGFTTGSPWEPPSAGFETANVATEAAARDSILSTYRSLIHLRATHPALALGTATPVDASDDGIFAVVRRSPEETLLVLSNLGVGDVTAPIVDLLPIGGCLAGSTPEVVYGSAETRAPGPDLTRFAPIEALPAGSTVIVQLKR